MRHGLRFGVLAAALAAAACASGPREENASPAGSAWTSPSTGDEIESGSVAEVVPETDSSRVFFYDPADFTHVYWYESSRPESWEYRNVYRDRGRTYVFDRDGQVVRRVYFDDARARDFDWSRSALWTPAQRDALGLSARLAWAQHERDEREGITNVTVDVDAVSDVPPEANPDRVYFLDPGDATYVYWFDPATPRSWIYRPYYRDGGRAYVLERNGSTLQRVYFDERRAKLHDWGADRRWSAAERDALRAIAREDWTRRAPSESDWRARWEQKVRAAEVAALAREQMGRGGEQDSAAVVDVQPDAYPDRTYFYDPADTSHVYWFDAASPGVWTYRPFYREGDRTFVLVGDGPAPRRIYFDDARARAFDLNKDTRWTVAERGTLRTAAREEWARRQLDESAWRSEWERRRLADQTAGRGAGSDRPQDEIVDLDSVSDVDADSVANWRYFYDAGDAGHVYWFDTSDPVTWHYRPVYRVGARTYFLDRDGGGVRRYYFDDARARRFDWRLESRWDEQQRARLRDAARTEWSHRERQESGWRGRWDQRHRDERR